MPLPRFPAFWPAVLIWLLFAAAMFVLDGWWSLSNLALLLVLGSTMASFWLGTWASVLVCALAVAAFNWFFVPPRYTFHVQLDQDLLLLVTLLGTSTLISVLTTRLRQHAQQQTEQARHAEHLQHLGAALQHQSSVGAQVKTAVDLLQQWTGLSVQLWLQDQAPVSDDPAYRAWQASQQEQGAIGPGTGRHESLPQRALPLRAGVLRIGTLVLGSGQDDLVRAAWPLDRLQACARLIADEIHRLQSDLAAHEALHQLQSQQLRNTLLAAISHDYRTPLATIASAASGLQEGADAQRTRQAVATILEETGHLHRMTSNTLQMARLDAQDATLQASWESAEELCGAALGAARRRHPARTLQTDVAPDLPLLWCDPVLIVQLLDNLLENALRYSPAQAPVTLQARLHEGAVLIKVLDRGIGIAPEWRERVFDPFLRVLPDTPSDGGFATSTRRGMGLGLALCRAIARLHRARLWIEARASGGTRVCLQFARHAQPEALPQQTPKDAP